MSRTLDRELDGVEKRLMVEVWVEELEPMVRCPKWHACSAPICPLDPQKDQRSPRIDEGTRGGVTETQCTLSKAKRMELGALLPWRGLWPRELASMKKWAEMTPTARRQLDGLGIKA